MSGSDVLTARHVHHSILSGSVGPYLGKLLQMGSGFVFWAIAAHAATLRELGIAAATVSAVMLCTQLGALGTGSAVITSIGRGGDPREVLDSALTVVLGSGVVCGLGYSVVTQLVSGDADPASFSPVWTSLFVLAAVAGTAQICFDQATVALGRGPGTVHRYAAGAAATVGAVGVLALSPLHVGPIGLFAAWACGVVVICVVGAAQLRTWLGRGMRPVGNRAWWPLVRMGIPNQVLTLTERLPAVLVPVLVAHIASPETTARWYPAWMLAWVAYSAPVLVGVAQFAEGARTGTGQRTVVVSGVRWSLLMGGSIALLLAAAAGPLLGLLGEDYATSARAVWILAVGTIPFAVIQAYNSAGRSRASFRGPVVLGVCLCVAICASTSMVSSRGPSAMALAWTLCTATAALWAGGRLLVTHRGGG